MEKPSAPPIAEKKPHVVNIVEHGAKIEDHFFYLRNKDETVSKRFSLSHTLIGEISV